MESILEILLFKDIGNKIRSRKLELKNYNKYYDQLEKFLILFKSYNACFPILKDSNFNNKICFMNWILKNDVVYLSLNCVYLYNGVLSYLECLTKEGDFVIINNDGSVRTFSGKRFRKKIEISEISKVDVFLTDSFFAKNDSEKFLKEKEIEKKYGDMFRSLTY
jgi:hypothetical protein